MRESLLSCMLIACVWTLSPADRASADPGADASPIASEEKSNSIAPRHPPDKTVDILASRANNWKEPSPRSEEIYVQAIRDWLDSLPRNKRSVTRQILRDAHPSLSALREAIRDKKAELASLSFSKDTSPEALPRLGQQLQKLRSSLRDELEKLGERLKIEAGVQMGPLGGDGFWLVPPVSEKSSMNFPVPKKIQISRPS
ncbi:MAG: periplasmic heavy metal sensor [Desulfovibrio sp.]|nr:periplasmic heavy metal sensor [Desulfovibrio sp.]